MPTVNKIDIILEAYQKLRISGITVDPTPKEIEAALRRMLGVIASLPWSIGYIFPESFDSDDPNDDSGLTFDLFDPVSSILAFKMAGDFGKQYSMMEYSDSMDTLARKFSEIEGGKYPETLPTGIANEYPNTINRYFYDGSQPTENIDPELI